MTTETHDVVDVGGPSSGAAAAASGSGQGRAVAVDADRIRGRRGDALRGEGRPSPRTARVDRPGTSGQRGTSDDG